MNHNICLYFNYRHNSALTHPYSFTSSPTTRSSPARSAASKMQHAPTVVLDSGSHASLSIVVLGVSAIFWRLGIILDYIPTHPARPALCVPNQRASWSDSNNANPDTVTMQNYWLNLPFSAD